MPSIDLGQVVGPTGATGPQGPQGIQGNPGPNQITSATSTNLNGVLAGSNGVVGVRAVDSAPNPLNETNLVSSAGVANAITDVVSGEILRFSGQAVSAATGAQICRIPASGTNSAITADHVLLDAVFANPAVITSNVTWNTYNGYMTLTGTATAATTVDITIGKKGN